MQPAGTNDAAPLAKIAITAKIAKIEATKTHY
jgi:hypothetical protein